MIIGSLSNWHTTVFNPAVELIDHFVSQVEPQIADAVQKYKAGRTYTDVHDADEAGREFSQEFESYGSLDSMTWDFKALFETHFPNLQRRSALITVYGSFEFELTRLCALFQTEKRLSIGASDLSGRGITQAANYLEKVAELKTLGGSRQWQTVDHIRIVRNMIVHRNGRLIDAQGRRPRNETNAINRLKYIRMSDFEVVLQPEFVPEVVKSFRSYFKLIDDAIRAKAT
jgi:hypothetical protein